MSLMGFLKKSLIKHIFKGSIWWYYFFWTSGCNSWSIVGRTMTADLSRVCTAFTLVCIKQGFKRDQWLTILTYMLSLCRLFPSLSILGANTLSHLASVCFHTLIDRRCWFETRGPWLSSFGQMWTQRLYSKVEQKKQSKIDYKRWFRLSLHSVLEQNVLTRLFHSFIQNFINFVVFMSGVQHLGNMFCPHVMRDFSDCCTTLTRDSFCRSHYCRHHAVLEMHSVTCMHETYKVIRKQGGLL